MKPDLARALVKDRPLEQAERLLGYIFDASGATSGAVLSVDTKGSLKAVVDRTSVDVLTAAAKHWRASEDVLRAGVPVNGQRFSLTPLRMEPDILVGLVLLEGVLAEDTGIDSDVAAVMAMALTATPPTIPCRESASAQEMLKEHTVYLLALYQGNISAVADTLGCTRRTVYEHMKKWNIERKKVPRWRRRPGGATDPDPEPSPA